MSYRFILFVSTSQTEIIKPRSIKRVTYRLHPTHPAPNRIQTEAPFFIDISGWGIFEIDTIIEFKNNFIRTVIETSHMLSVDALTSITCAETKQRNYHKHLFKYQHFKQFLNESMIAKASFVNKVKARLKRNLSKTPSPVYFDGFDRTLNDFKIMFKECIVTHSELSYLSKLNVPDTIFDVIGYFAVFAVSLFDIAPNQEVYIEDCKNSEIVIGAPKFNHLRLRRCNNMTITFPYIMSKCELIDCFNVRIICTRFCFTYRFDTSDNINVQFADPGSRVTFLCFNTPNVLFKSVVDEEKDEKYSVYPHSLGDAPDIDRLSVRWRSDQNIGWSWKVFDAEDTLGSVTR